MADCGWREIGAAPSTANIAGVKAFPGLLGFLRAVQPTSRLIRSDDAVPRKRRVVWEPAHERPVVQAYRVACTGWGG